MDKCREEKEREIWTPGGKEKGDMDVYVGKAKRREKWELFISGETSLYNNGLAYFHVS